MSKQRKIRIEFRKNRTPRTRLSNWTQQFASGQFEEHDPEQSERIGKDAAPRKRTVMGEQVEANPDQPGMGVRLDVDQATCWAGRVLSIHGLTCEVQTDDGRMVDCAVRRLLKTMSTDQRHVVAVGDRVLFRPVLSEAAACEGIIERIEPRRGSLCRSIRGRQQVLVTNVDQLLIVTSAAEPRLKPHLIDRMLMSAEKGRVEPVICINKIDLVDPAGLQPLVGVYSQMGYRVMLMSAETGQGMEPLRGMLADRESVVVGQSGVGKSSLLNRVDPTLRLAVQTVSEETEKGRHTTTNARLVPLSFGGYVVDTPGIRQFELWDVIPAEVAGFFRDLRPYVNLCRFPDCTHTHEAECAVKNAVADGQLDERRYESYCLLFSGDKEAFGSRV